MSTIKKGDKGDQVKSIQKILKALGYNVDVDGIFGSGTEKEVKSFQSDFNLGSDGIIGSGTLSVLNSFGKTVRKGDKGAAVKALQTLIKKKGYTVDSDGIFGSGTEAEVKKLQASTNQAADGIAGKNTWKALGYESSGPIQISGTVQGEFDEKYKDVVFPNAIFPDDTVKDSWNVKLNDTMTGEYLPALADAMGDQPKGFQLLCTVMAHKEGFYPKSRSYRTNNPGNIGNTDEGRNRDNSTLKDGILLQKNYIQGIVEDKNRSYPMNKEVNIKPYFSPEIARNPQYGLPPYLPGYKFEFTGQLNQFVKIYATGARATNSYLSMIVSFFKQNGYSINQESKIQDIINLN